MKKLKEKQFTQQRSSSRISYVILNAPNLNSTKRESRERVCKCDANVMLSEKLEIRFLSFFKNVENSVDASKKITQQATICFASETTFYIKIFFNTDLVKDPNKKKCAL